MRVRMLANLAGPDLPFAAYEDDEVELSDEFATELVTGGFAVALDPAVQAQIAKAAAKGAVEDTSAGPAETATDAPQRKSAVSRHPSGE